MTLNHRGLHIICLNMFLEMTFPCKLLITLITRILDTFMLRLNMFLKTTHCCSLIITQITRILDTFMNRLKMCFKNNLFCKLLSTMIMIDTWNLHGQTTCFFCCLIIKFITRKHDFFMERLNMFLHTAWFSKLFPTFMTRILNFHMDGVHMFMETPLFCKKFVTLKTVLGPLWMRLKCSFWLFFYSKSF